MGLFLRLNELMLSFKPLTPKTWTDLQVLFGEKGASGGCWCMYWRLTNKDYECNKGASNKRKLLNLVEQEQPLGILAFDDDDPVGWCAVSPRDNFIRLENSRLLKRIDDQPVWSIPCLFVNKKCRRKGVSVSLIQEAAAYAFAKGARILEAYPIIPKKDKVPPIFAWIGFVHAFEKAGFQKVAQPSETRLIMRLVNQ